MQYANWTRNDLCGQSGTKKLSDYMYDICGFDRMEYVESSFTQIG